MPTTLAQELAEQRRWKLRPEWAGFDLHQRLVANEFLTPAELEEKQRSALRRVLDQAATAVPFYRDQWAGLGFAPEQLRGLSDLVRLPILTRADVQGQKARLHARSLPRGQRHSGMSKTSGSTGQPVEIRHSHGSMGMFNVLKQRQLRWARFDPQGRFGVIRSPQELSSGPDGRALDLDETLVEDSWQRQVGSYFETGPMFGFSNRNPMDRQVDWLAESRIDYLLAQSAELEHLALAARARPTPVALRGLFAISQQLTEDMRHCIEQTFGAPVHENYGLNEIGIVATLCREGGRYHVNAEHCLVEIVDEGGRPVAAGERGRLLVSGLSNFAMPLLRYDSGDLAEAVEGPCPCGRTLPAFGRIHGRYRRLAALPEGSYAQFISLRRALGGLPPELSHYIRQFQVHHGRDGRYELRLVVSKPPPPALAEKIQADWAKATAPADIPLTIRFVEVIPLPPGGKFQDFLSDFMPPPDNETQTTPEKRQS